MKTQMSDVRSSQSTLERCLGCRLTTESLKVSKLFEDGRSYLLDYPKLALLGNREKLAQWRQIEAVGLLRLPNGDSVF